MNATARRYPVHVADALVINPYDAYCGRCEKPASADEQVHGWTFGNGSGCGVRWARVTTAYAGLRMERAVRARRPDLPFVQMWPEPDGG